MAPTTVVVQDVNPTVVNYGQPIAVDAPPPPETEVEQAIASFDQARAAFRAGDYDLALQQVERALGKLPNDVDLHEFRAVVQFARGQYQEAASGLYAVLMAGPGWNWATLIGLYPDVDTFTRQLRALESYIATHREDAAARFVLAYLYITMGATDAAVAQLKEVIRLVPNDRLSAQLVSELEKKEQGAVTTATPPASPDGGTTPGPADISGRWTAQGAQGGTITLDLGADGKFTWTYTTQGQSRSFQGTYAYENGLLTLVRQEGPPIVGRVTWIGDNRFTFTLVGAGPGDPGLTFSR
jgi:tetratricopeptide (TPR) repeat protein